LLYSYVLVIGTTVSSEELVPGDVVNIMEENLTLFPADMFLLSGDVIVNESMLTGESVPIAKIPVKGEDFVRWSESGPIGPETAKGFLYAGTKVIRVRGVLTPTSDEQALAVVVRTGNVHIVQLFHSSNSGLRAGFSTTKGSLIRSMLFPKPMGFKFYRDSMRFVIFLAGIAGLGFLASAIQFIKIGVRLICCSFSGETDHSPDQIPYHRASRPRFNNGRRASSSSGDVVDWHQLCDRSSA
jgi:cation-transporting ATPase 13A2